MAKALDAEDFATNYQDSFRGDERWELLENSSGNVYQWDENSTYIRETSLFRNISPETEHIPDIRSARVLLKLGDSITTDHISPAGFISENSPAGEYLKSRGVEKKDFNSYGSRRGNHEVMVRGTFANVRLKNELVDREGGWTVHYGSGRVMTVYDAAMEYMASRIPLIILAGKEYGSGSSRDWAAKGASMLGVRAIMAVSFERIHRSNLVGTGVLPLAFKKGEDCKTLGLNGDETYNILGMDQLSPNKELAVIASRPSGTKLEFGVIARLDSEIEVAYFRNSGILQYVLRSILEK